MKQLQKYFDIALDIPDGIKKLKELILTLAMQGKLVKQDPNDQPANELLKEIEKEKQKLIQEGKLKKQEPLQPIKPEEIPYTLPKGWVWVRLGDIAIFENGDRSRKYPNENDHQEYGVPFFGAKDMIDGKLRYDNDLRFISIEKFSELNNGKLKNQDFVFLLRGSVGKMAVFYANDKFKTGFINAQMVIVRTFIKVINDFIKHYFVSKYFNNMIYHRTTGSAINQMPANALQKFLIPLPPLAEQKRIVSKVDELMKLCDTLEDERKERNEKRLAIHASAIHNLLSAQDQKTFDTSFRFITKHFDELYTVKQNVIELKKVILQLAVQGKLVKQDQNDQPANELLKEIEKEKQKLIQEGKLKKQEPLQPIKPEEISYTLPKGWVWVRLGNIGEINPRNNFEDEKDVGFVPMNLIYSDYGKIHNFEKRKWSEIKKGYTHFSNNDIAIAKITPCFENRKSCIFQNLPNGIGAGTTELHVFRNTFNSIFPPYLLGYFKNPQYIKNGISKMTGTAGQKRVPTEYFSLYPFPLPPLDEQKRIVSKIDQLMKLCDTLEEQIVNASEKQAEIFNSVLASVV